MSKNKYGFKSGELIAGKQIENIEGNEVFFTDGTWTYDYELFCQTSMCKDPSPEYIKQCSNYRANDECPFSDRLDVWEVHIDGDFIDHETLFHEAVDKKEKELKRDLEEDEYEALLKEHEYGDNGYEVSVIKKDNEHGHNSWGWGGCDKIILFGTGLGQNDLDYSPESEAFAKKVAELLCDALNKEEVSYGDS